MGALGNKIIRAVQGFGEGYQGRGQEFIQGLKDERKKAMVEDSFRIQGALSRQDVPAARKLLQQRVDLLTQNGDDPSDSQGYLEMLDQGDVAGVMGGVTDAVNWGYANKMLAPPAAGAKPQLQVVDGNVVDLGASTATPIQGFNPDTEAARSRKRANDLRERELDLKETVEDRQANKLSAGLEKVQLEAADNVIKYQGDAVNFQTMANEFATRPDDLYGGVRMTLNERFKSILGTQDNVTELRRKLNAIRVSEGIGNLPPGVASDKDIELVMSGQIQENASPEQVVQYLTGATKMAQYSAAYNQLKADFITKKRTGAGLNQAYRSSHQSSVLKRKVTVAEIYRTAQIRGINPEDVAAQLGIEGELF